MNIGRMCTQKIVYCDLEATALDAARIMRSGHVGDVIVVDDRDGRRKPVGIVTDRDLVVLVMAKEVDPASVTVSEVMGRELVVADEREDIHDTIHRMSRKGIRRIPVVNASGDLVGVAAVDDLTEILTGALVDLSRISGRQRAHEEAHHP